MILYTFAFVYFLGRVCVCCPNRRHIDISQHSQMLARAAKPIIKTLIAEMHLPLGLLFKISIVFISLFIYLFQFILKLTRNIFSLLRV